MIYSAEFERWFELNYPNVYRASIGLGCWSPEQRYEAAKKKERLHSEWLAKNEQDGAQ